MDYIPARVRDVKHKASVTAKAIQAQRVASQYEKRQRRLPRSRELLEAVAQMDVSQDPVYQRELSDWVKDRYIERGGGELIGLFSKCYLGPPYVDHQMDLGGSILQHFKQSDVPPVEFLMCRALAQSEAYLYIEVYSDGEVVPIRLDGSVGV